MGPRAHLRAVLEKAWVLGVPYFVFTAMSWMLKRVTAPWVNHPAVGSVWDAFLAMPAPYWFLPVLVALFALLPRVLTVRAWGFLMLAAAGLKAYGLLGPSWLWPLLLRRVAQHGFWFASGMGLAFTGTDWLRKPKGGRVGAACATLFLAGSVLAAVFRWWPPPWRWRTWFHWSMGVLACAPALAWAARRKEDGWPDAAWRWLGRRVLPIFLMHTLFASGIRMALLALGIWSAWLHVPAAFAASVVGPPLALQILEWLRLDGLVYPRRFRRPEKRIGPGG